MEEEQAQPKKKTWSRRPKGPNISGDDAKVIVEALLAQIQSGATTKTLDTETKANLDQEFKSQIEKYHAEPHYWVTFHKMGDDDNVDTVYIGAAGVGYTCRKGERVLLPQSALNCLKYNVREGVDPTRPSVMINGQRYMYKIKQPLNNYTIEPQVVTPEEAAHWRAKIEKQMIDTQHMVPVGPAGESMEDLIPV